MIKLGASLLFVTLIAASPEVRYFRYQRSIENVPQQGGQTCVDLEPEIFAHSAAQLADLRVYRDGTETPYVIRVATPEAGAEKSITPINVGVRAGQTVFDAEFPDTHYSDLQLNVTGQDFIATVTVAGSRTKDGRASTKLGAFTIFDLTRQRLGRSTVLHLPQSDFEYLHFSIAGPLRPDAIKGISVERLPATQPRYMTVAESSKVTEKGRTSIVEFTVAAHVPVDQVAFIPGSSPALFSRAVSISVAPVAVGPATDRTELPQAVVTTGDLLRVHSSQNGHRIDEERLTMDAPNVDFDTAAKWTVMIDNGDDAPVALTSVRLRALERTLCFEAAANASYTLYYGDAVLASPRYDYATLFAAQANAAQAKAGQEQLNAVFQARPDERPFTERHPALLWIALIVVIALLGGIALRSAKRPT